MCENGCLTLPPILVMCVYSRVNEGSGTLPFRCCVCVTPGGTWSWWICLSWMVCGSCATSHGSSCFHASQPNHETHYFGWRTMNFDSVVCYLFSSLCVTLKLIVCRGVCDYCFLALKCSLYLWQMLVTESRFAPCPSCQTCATLKACLNLRVVSLAAIGICVVICW